MKRLSLLWLVAIVLCLVASVAEARHFHHGHWGHHHHWGGFGGGHAYRHWGGYGGLGWGGYGYGYRPWGGVSLSIGVRPAYYGWSGAWPSYGYSYGYRPYGWGGYYGGYYRSYYTSPVWPTYNYYPSSYYYYPSSYYYYGPAYGYPAYGYPAWGYFGSSSPVNVTNLVVRAAKAPAPTAFDRSELTTVARASIGSRSRARQLLRLGDEAFRLGRYVEALARYRNAADLVPEMAEAHFRKGHAYLANGQYSLATMAFRRALQLEPTARRDAFQLDDLYGVGSAAQGTHIENLAAAALTDDSADTYFLLGLMLRFDGQLARAEKFFAKAASLSPETRKAVASLLPVEMTEPVSLEVGDEI